MSSYIKLGWTTLLQLLTPMYWTWLLLEKTNCYQCLHKSRTCSSIKDCNTAQWNYSLHSLKHIMSHTDYTITTLGPSEPYSFRFPCIYKILLSSFGQILSFQLPSSSPSAPCPGCLEKKLSSMVHFSMNTQKPWHPMRLLLIWPTADPVWNSNYVFSPYWMDFYGTHLGWLFS